MKLNLKVLDRVEEELIARYKEAINAGLEVAKEGIDSRTPEREGELLENNMIAEADEVGGQIKGKVYNTTPYGIFVEKGVKGRVYKYRKPRGFVFYVGHGARMFTRTAKEDKQKILQAIRKKLL